MKSILHALFTGDLCFAESIGSTPEIDLLWTQMEKGQSELKSALTPEQASLLDACLDNRVENTTLYGQQCFAKGYQLGSLIMLEVLAGEDYDPRKLFNLPDAPI